MAITKTARTHSGMSKYTGTFGDAEILHLLKRTMFGATKDDLDHFSGMSLDQVVDAILNVDYTVPSPPLRHYSNSDPNVSLGQTWVNDINGSLNPQRMDSFKRWWMGEIIHQDRTIREKMVLFWHNHFATETQIYGWANMAYNQNALLRANALKNFKTLVKEISLDASMLIYLNGERNTKTAPDENYARELMELFTLGKGPDSQYLELDVRMAAKVLTGFRVNRSDGTSFFDPNRHDESNKTFSDFFGNTVVTGQSGTAGAGELDALLDMIFNQDEVAKFMARNIYRWFVYYEIDEAAETNVITPMANAFRSNGYEIKPMLELLFKSEHFYDNANRGALIKSPVDFVAGIFRQFDIAGNNTFIAANDPENNRYPTLAQVTERYYMYYLLYLGASVQQQTLGDPPSVAGWAAYYQVPQYHELWINSDTLPNRNKISDYLCIPGYRYNDYQMRVDGPRLADKFSNAGDPTEFIQGLIDLFFTLDVSNEQKDFMKSILLGGQADDFYWTNEWGAYKSGNPSTAPAKLVQLYKYMMNLAEYQLS